MTTHAHAARPVAPPKPPPRPCGGRRRAFVPSPPPGPYRLPAPILDRLTRDLAGFRNAPAALALAVFLGRMWSAPRRVNQAFPVDRRALVGHAALGLTEARVRGALATLEAIGFLSRPPVIGRTHQRTAEGLHRKPLLWRFAPEFLTLFRAAHAARGTAVGARSASRRSLGAPPRECPPAGPGAAPISSPKGTASALKAQRSGAMIMGDRSTSGIAPREGRRNVPVPATPCPALAAALDRLTFARSKRANALK